MADPIMFFEFVCVLIGAIFIGKIIYDHNKAYKKELREAQEEYKDALKLYVENPDNLIAKEQCFLKGDYYYSFIYPNHYEFNIEQFDFNTYSNTADLKPVRRDIIRQDIVKMGRELGHNIYDLNEFRKRHSKKEGNNKLAS